MFLLDWLSLSPLLGLDALAGAQRAGGVGVLGSARVAINGAVVDLRDAAQHVPREHQRHHAKTGTSHRGGTM